MVVDLLKTGEKSAPTDQMSISHLLATKPSYVLNKKYPMLQADSVDYTPATGIFIISGSQYVPAVMYDTQGISTGTFRKLYYKQQIPTNRTDGRLHRQ